MLFGRWQDLKPDEPPLEQGIFSTRHPQVMKERFAKCHFQKHILTWSNNCTWASEYFLGGDTLFIQFFIVYQNEKSWGDAFQEILRWVYFFWCWSLKLNASNELGWFVKHQILRSHHRGDQIFWCSGYSLLWALFGSTAVGLGMSLGNHSWCLFFSRWRLLHRPYIMQYVRI